ncbi:MAG TPA: DUF4846 domain-containing protein [Phycisphaerae bacterium]|nr:DUF4846 domain-containing protein [Phycisphaerae bacterium]
MSRWPDAWTPHVHRAVGRAAGLGAFLWQHSFRAVTVLLVALVVFTAARQVPSGGSKTTQTPPVAEAVVHEAPKPIDWPQKFAWLSKRSRGAFESLSKRIPPPEGFARVSVEPGSFADWLRHLPVAAADRAVTNSKHQTVFEPGDSQLAAVIDLQPGAGNLLLPPAMLVRLRAEYLWSAKADNITFHYTSGHEARWEDWVAGQRPSVQGKKVSFRQERPRDDSRDSFCSYLETLFRYTTIYSVFNDSEPVGNGTIAAGDMFVVTGRRDKKESKEFVAQSAVLVLDVATNPEGRVKVLLGQGGNPAQTFHVLKSPEGDPWFTVSQSQGVTLSGRDTLKLKYLRRWKS